ncbi:MAG: sodium-dependent transporter [Lachnospiraceae bacterium]|nr:sodium-dependent transporter [Lachnospiraceae bacterium]
MAREQFKSRLGFLFIAAGCAIGLGNVWRFPYITGKYGGGAFVLLYFVFLLLLGIPVLSMELSVGRASKQSAIKSFEALEPKGTKWHVFGYIALAGNVLLMMFYTTICGWMLSYVVKMLTGELSNLSTEGVKVAFDDMSTKPGPMIFWMFVSILIGTLVCSLGLQKGVERITKWMMICLFAIMIVLSIKAVTLPGAAEGLKFYLIPDFSKMVENGIMDTIFAAMSQAFFTLSIGIGSIAIFGSYIGKDRALLGEAVSIASLDTFVALVAGMIIFPSCFAFDIEPDSGPNLIFVTLPNVFNQMAGGKIWGALFFVFMSCAALSTVIGVFENIISMLMENWNISRKKAVLINFVLILVLSLPAVLGYNVLSGIKPLGKGTTILDFEDFLVSSNILPLGSLVYVLFCTRKKGWGFKKYFEEVNTGKGLKIPEKIRFYVTWILPIIVLFVFVQGYLSMFVFK